MKDLSKAVLIASSIVTLTMAQNIDVTSDWKLVGASEVIDITHFDNTCADVIWQYNTTGWSLYKNSSTYVSIPSGITQVTTGNIDVGKGFWIKGNSSCIVDTTVATQAQETSSTYALTSSDIAGKAITIDFNDGEGYVVLSLNSDYTGTEVGYFQNGALEYSDAITWEIMDGKLKITLGGEISYYTFNAKPALGVTGTTTLEPGKTYSITSFGDAPANYIGTWSGTVNVNVPAAASTCVWNISLTINSDDTASADAILGTTTGIGDTECDSFSSTNGTISNKTENGFTFNVDATSSDYIFGGNIFTLNGSGDTVTEIKNFSIDGFSGTRTTSITKE